MLRPKNGKLGSICAAGAIVWAKSVGIWPAVKMYGPALTACGYRPAGGIGARAEFTGAGGRGASAARPIRSNSTCASVTGRLLTTTVVLAQAPRKYRLRSSRA